MTLNVQLTDLAAERLETFARDGETASYTVSRVIHEFWALQQASGHAAGIDAARLEYRRQTGHWPEGQS